MALRLCRRPGVSSGGQVDRTRCGCAAWRIAVWRAQQRAARGVVPPCACCPGAVASAIASAPRIRRAVVGSGAWLERCRVSYRVRQRSHISGDSLSMKIVFRNAAHSTQKVSLGARGLARCGARCHSVGVCIAGSTTVSAAANGCGCVVGCLVIAVSHCALYGLDRCGVGMDTNALVLAAHSH